jgi:hypothetical protein
MLVLRSIIPAARAGQTAVFMAAQTAADNISGPGPAGRGTRRSAV